MLRGAVGTSVKLSLERDPTAAAAAAATVSDTASVYSTNMSIMSTSSYDGRKANTVVRIKRTQPPFAHKYRN